MIDMQNYSYHAVDTETINGKAFLFASVNDVYPIEDFHDFVSECRRFALKRTANFTWYNLDYDVTGLVKHLAPKIVKKLFVEGECYFEETFLKYIPGKYFRVSQHGYTFHHYDLYSFFQMSLDRAAEKFGVAERKMKVSRRFVSSLNRARYFAEAAYREKWNAYARQDCIVLQRLTDKLIDALREIGHSQRHIYSPGYVAKGYLKRNNVKFGTLPAEHLPFVDKCFHGACVEIYQRGNFPKAYSYDVKSAYPYAISLLPDFENARYYKTRTPKTKHYYAKVRVWMEEAEFYPLPALRANIVRFPRYFGHIAYVTNEEIDVLNEIGARYEFLDVLNVECDESSLPYESFINTVFQKRNGGAFESLSYKLTLNSMFGITAEKQTNYKRVTPLRASQHFAREMHKLGYRSFVLNQAELCPDAKFYWMRTCNCDVCEDTRSVMRESRGKRVAPILELGLDLFSRREYPGKMYNPAVAAKITAITRCRMYRIKRTLPPNSVIACFTDSVKTTKPYSGVLGTNLGDLTSETTGERLLMIGCGVYQHGETVKLRGFHYRGSLIELCEKQQQRTVLRVPCTNRLSGIEYATESNRRFDELNLIVSDSKSLDLNFDSKRIWPKPWRNAGELLRNRQRSFPLDFGQ